MDTEYDTLDKYLNQSGLVPDKVNAIVDEALSQIAGFVLDGYRGTSSRPRNSRR